MLFRLISALTAIIAAVAIIVLVVSIPEQQPAPAKPVDHRPVADAVTGVRARDDDARPREATPTADARVSRRRANRGEIGEFREPLPDMGSRITHKNAATIEIGDYKDPDGDYYVQRTNSPSATEIGRWKDPDAHSQVTGQIPLRTVGNWIGMPDDPRPRRTNDQPVRNIGEPKEVPRNPTTR